MKFLLRTFGCQMNYADSEKIIMILLQSGLTRTNELSEADIVILNTCSVRQKGEDKVFSYLRDTKRLAETEGRTVFMGLTGCMVRKTGMNARYHQSDRKRETPKSIERLSSVESIFNSDDKLFGRSDLMDFTFRIEETGYLTKILTALTGTDIGNDAGYEDYLRIRQKQQHKASANVIIQTGCDNFCTFCIVPHTRGRELSRPQEEVVDEVRRVVSEWSLEVTLLGQNVNSYGKETKKSLWNTESLTWQSSEVKTPFRALLDAVDSVSGLDRIRFTSSNPHDMTRDILDAHFELPYLCNCLHFALQSGSDTMLARMNRKHTYADFLAQVRYLRGRDPLFSITTDIIVGFPWETEEEFLATVRAFEECEFDFAYIARYSERSGTTAAKRSPDDVPANIKAERWDILNRALHAGVVRRNDMMIGRTETVLVESMHEGIASGRTRNFKEVFFSVDEDFSGVGTLVDVRITQREGWILRGEKL